MKNRVSSLIFGTFFTLSGLASFEAGAVATDLPVHVIVPIHGLRGEAASYGDFAELVQDHLPKIDGKYKIVVPKVSFDIYSDTFSTSEVTKALNEQISVETDKLHAGKGLQDGDKVSVLLYSMGGNVGLPWLLETVNSPNPKYLSIVKHLENFIGLGAPYWGSLEAGNFMEVLKNGQETLNIDFVGMVNDLITNPMLYHSATKFNMAQVELLAAGSKAMPDLRNAWIDFISNKKTSDYLSKIHFVNMVGMIPCMNIVDKNQKDLTSTNLKSLGFVVQAIASGDLTVEFNNDCRGDASSITKSVSKTLNSRLFGSFGEQGRRESDMVVPAPSATLDFFYRNADGEFRRTASAFKKDALNIPFLETRHVQVSHATLDASKWDDYVVITKDHCGGEKLFTTDCNRFYKYLLFYLADGSERGSKYLNDIFKNGDHVKKGQKYEGQKQVREDDDVRTEQLQGYILDINLKLPPTVSAETVKEDLSLGKIFENIKFDFVPMSKPAASSSATDFFGRLMEAGAQIIHTAMSAQEELQLVLEHPEKDHVLVYGDKQARPYTVQLGRIGEVGSRIIRAYSTEGKNEIHIELMGRVVPDYALNNQYTPANEKAHAALIKNGIALPRFTVEIPGTKPVQISNALVKPGVSTFIELEMASE